jgi:hypothetical protein
MAASDPRVAGSNEGSDQRREHQRVGEARTTQERKPEFSRAFSRSGLFHLPAFLVLSVVVGLLFLVPLSAGSYTQVTK